MAYSTSILPVNLYMTMGSLEGSMVDDYFRMTDILDSRNYEYFSSSYHLNFNQDHSSNKELSFREGIKWALRQSIDVPYEDPSAIRQMASMQTVAYPNPVNDVLTINMGNGQSEIVKIELFDYSGKTIYQGVCVTSEFKLNVSAFPKGFYLLKVDGTEVHSCTKIRVY